jgi:anti-anti-sigma factor
MNITTNEHGDITVMAIEGRLDGQHAQAAEQAFLALAAQEGKNRFVLDFAQMAYISSAGLRVVLVAAKKVKAAQGRLVCAGMNDQVRDVFEMSGFISILETAANREEAIAMLQG